MKTEQIEKQILVLEEQLSAARKSLAKAKKQEQEAARRVRFKRLEKVGLLDLPDHELDRLLAGIGMVQP